MLKVKRKVGPELSLDLASKPAPGRATYRDKKEARDQVEAMKLPAERHGCVRVLRLNRKKASSQQ